MQEHKKTNSLQPKYVKENLWMHNTSDVEADGQEQQETVLSATSVS